jgi:GNAT superfamily N-acetyltransferase
MSPADDLPEKDRPKKDRPEKDLPDDEPSADGVVIRPARERDAAAVGRLWLDLLEAQAALDERMGVADDALERWRNDFPMWLRDDTRRIIVAEATGEAKAGEGTGSEGTTAIHGFASAHRWGPAPVYRDAPEVFLDELYVRPAARRQGIGSRLVAAVTDWADEGDAHRIRLRVLDANEEGRAFWEAQDAVAFTHTLTLERPHDDETKGQEAESEGSKKIGF